MCIISPIKCYCVSGIYLNQCKKNIDYCSLEQINEADNLLEELNKMSEINKTIVNVPREYELNLSHDELAKRISKTYMTTKKMLDVDAVEYTSLSEGDKKALKHLVQAAYILEEINLKLDNVHNIPFRDFLNKEMANQNDDAALTRILFEAQKGVCAIDRESNKIELAKGVSEKLGKGLYPEDLSVEEFHSILKTMVNEGKIDEVRKILNQRRVIEREGSQLKATDYIDKYSVEFGMMAHHLDEAAKVSSNEAFNEFLKLQAKALRKADPMLDAYADKQWATLQDTPLEFTITRENYSDEMTQTVIENPELMEILAKYDIKPVSKDFLGGRVGIVNKEGTDAILKVKEFLPLMAKNMPFNKEYEQNISPDEDSKQTMVDVDLVAVTGDVGEFRGGITLAENLPNDDKLSLTIGGGRRNVYHRQIRLITSEDARQKMQERLDAILDKEQHKFYNDEADHWFTIGHENGHSLGPNKNREALGKYQSIIEENKADIVSLAMMDILTEAGLYTAEQRNQIIVTFAADNLLKSKPTMSQAHRVRTVMQNYYFMKEGAIEISEDGKLHVNIEKMIPTAQKMLEEIVRIQIDADFAKGEKYVLDNFQWTDSMEIIAEKLKSVSKSLNGRVESPLAMMLLEDKKEEDSK